MTWTIKPAIIIFFPKFFPFTSFAVDAIPPPKTLEDKTEKIERAEHEHVRPRLEPRKVCSVGRDNSREAEIDACCEESRRYRHADKVDEEGVVVERVLVDHDSANVSHHFEYLTRNCQYATL